MRIKERLKECSYLWVIYTIIGSLFAVIIALALYLLTMGIFTYYIMNSNILNIISQNSVKYGYIVVAELVFVFLVIRGLYRETGDTVLIDIIKSGGSMTGCTLVDTTSVLVGIKDITVYLKDKVCNINSLNDLVEYNNTGKHGYIVLRNKDVGFEDICFLSDLKITAQENNTGEYVLKINNYAYSGYKLLSRQSFNTFELVEPVSNVEYNSDFYTNKYINRLYKANVYDYPISFATDIRDGIKSSKISLIIIGVCCVILFGIYGVYRNFSSASFLSTFEQEVVIDGLTIMTDADNYADYAVYIEDSIKILPDKLKREAIRDGWKIAFVKNDLSEYEILNNTVEPGATSGCTLPFYKLIVYKMPEDTEDTSKLFLMETIFHEFGHVFSLYTGSLNDEWRNIYNEDAPYYLTNYARSGVSEGFACCFASYLLNGELLKLNTPKTYDYIDRVVKNYLATG